MQIKQWTEGESIDCVLLVRDVETRRKSDGGEFLRVTFGDRSGQIPAMIWDDVVELGELLRVGSPVRVRGRYEKHARYGPQLKLAGAALAEPGSFAPDALLDGPPRAAAQMESDLRELLGTIQNPHLCALLARVFGKHSPTWACYRDAPAAKHYHQAYRHGLLEHSLGVAQAVSAISATFPGIDRDVAVSGALLHDIGKLEAYESVGFAIEMSDEGKLQGEIPLGYFRVRREIEDLDGFPQELAQALLHIILSHHGSLEHGSPVVPCTREATLVHMVDNLGGRLGSFDRLEKELPGGARWSRFDRAIGSGAFFAQPAGAEDDEVRRAA
ncbi:MAG: 3'-5' exoribonuclease YhaM family protein [Solirubrobacteraceae bacterium]